MELVEITLEVPLENPLKIPERSKLVSTLADAFSKSGILQVVIKETYFIDSRSPLVPSDGVLRLAVNFALGGAAVQVIEALDNLIEDGRASSKKLLVRMGSESLVDNEGNLISDDEITKLIWTARNFIEPSNKTQTQAHPALVYGMVVYPLWSTDPISIVITLNNHNIIHEIINGTIRGLAAQIKVKWFSCSICSENIEQCEHKVGENYNGKACVAVPRDIQFLEESLTSGLVDSRCKVTDLLLLDDGSYTWYGFQGVNILDRLKNINNSLKDKIINKEAASKFRFYFSRRSVGHCKYRNSDKGIKSKGSAASRRKVAKA